MYEIVATRKRDNLRQTAAVKGRLPCYELDGWHEAMMTKCMTGDRIIDEKENTK